MMLRECGLWLPPFEEGGDVVPKSTYVVGGVVGSWWEVFSEIWVACENGFDVGVVDG
jgi:hypothetical protein